MKHNKLVRDKIPNIIERGGDRPVVRTLNAGAYERALKRKLQEEVAEFVESGRVEELADVLEVVYALAEVEGMDRDRLEAMWKKKRRERGGFERRIFLVEVQPAVSRGES